LGSGITLALALVLEACGSSSKPAASKGGNDAAGTTPTTDSSTTATEAGSTTTTPEATTGATDSTLAPAEVQLPATTLNALAGQQPDVVTAEVFEEVAIAHNAAVLATGGPFTVFLPTIEALKAGLKQLLAAHQLPLVKDQLLQLARAHVVSGVVLAADLGRSDLTTLTDMNGHTLAVARSGGATTIGGAQVVTPDLLFEGGVVHLVDAMLIDPALTQQGSGPAPVPGSLGDAVNTQPDLVFAASCVTAPVFQGMLDIPNLTVFVPNDAAVTHYALQLLATGVPTDMNPAADTVVAHMVTSSFDAATLATMNGQTLTSFDGPPLAVTVAGGAVQVGGATIVRSVATPNGILHVVDKVLQPQA